MKIILTIILTKPTLSALGQGIPDPWKSWPHYSKNNPPTPTLKELKTEMKDHFSRIKNGSGREILGIQKCPCYGNQKVEEPSTSKKTRAGSISSHQEETSEKFVSSVLLSDSCDEPSTKSFALNNFDSVVGNPNKDRRKRSKDEKGASISQSLEVSKKPQNQVLAEYKKICSQPQVLQFPWHQANSDDTSSIPKRPVKSKFPQRRVATCVSKETQITPTSVASKQNQTEEVNIISSSVSCVCKGDLTRCPCTIPFQNQNFLQSGSSLLAGSSLINTIPICVSAFAPYGKCQCCKCRRRKKKNKKTNTVGTQSEVNLPERKYERSSVKLLQRTDPVYSSSFQDKPKSFFRKNSRLHETKPQENSSSKPFTPKDTPLHFIYNNKDIDKDESFEAHSFKFLTRTKSSSSLECKKILSSRAIRDRQKSFVISAPRVVPNLQEAESSVKKISKREIRRRKNQEISHLDQMFKSVATENCKNNFNDVVDKLLTPRISGGEFLESLNKKSCQDTYDNEDEVYSSAISMLIEELPKKGRKEDKSE